MADKFEKPETVSAAKNVAAKDATPAMDSVERLKAVDDVIKKKPITKIGSSHVR